MHKQGVGDVAPSRKCWGDVMPAIILASTLFLTACGGGVSLSSYIQPYLNKAASVAQNLDVQPTPECAVGDRDCDPFGE